MAATTGTCCVEDMYQEKYPILELASADAGVTEKPAILALLSSLLNRVVATNDKFLLLTSGSISPPKLTVFHGQRIPAISIEKYLERVFKYANCSASCFLVACAYIDRFIYQNPDIPITSLNVHRLLITSVMVAAKFLDDAFYNNSFYAKIGGVATYELNKLELSFLFCLNFRLQVTVNVFDRYCAHLARQIAPFHIEKSVQFVCGLEEASHEKSKEAQIMVPRCRYFGI